MRIKIAIAVIVTVACIPSYAAKRSDKKQLHSIVLLPIQVSLTRMSMKGAESMMEAASDSELPLTLEIQAALHDLGYQLDFQPLSTKSLRQNSEQERYTVDDLQKKFDSQLKLMRRNSKDLRRGRFSVGDEVLQLPLSDSVDALLFVRVHGQVLTESRKAFGTFIAGPRNDYAMLEFGFVDAKTGQVLYLARSAVLASLSQDPEEVATGISRAFAGLVKVVAPAAGDIAKANATAGASTNIDTQSQAFTATNAPIRRLPLSHVVVKDLLIEKVAPKYPGIAISSHVEGDVVLRVVIGTNGKVADVKTESGAVQLIPAATSAVKQWRYRPLTLDGETFEVETQITTSFRLGR